ncbi:DUF305 domain-containing protein [Longispora albida]|uniref:DUF305 domain-containing protein n=1 Tax=Longispora albida TaxID=203523 RepID=UPI00038023DA|nr:DUF305 domain-containing protein [Longispora albida]
MRRVLLAVVSVLFAGACSTPAGSPPPVAGSPVHAQHGPATFPANSGFNGTDVMFLQMMVPHHKQGIEIARLAKERTVRSDVRVLAAAIESTQDAEAGTMAGWLRIWGQPPTADPGSHAAHGGMPGTSAEEIEILRKAPEGEFERRLLNMLIAHQDDAVQLARMETSGGANTQTRELARRIDTSRSAQIKEMLGYLR